MQRMASVNGAVKWILLVTLGLSGGCKGCGGGGRVTLELVDPEDGAVLTRDADVDDESDGVQIDVQVHTANLAETDLVGVLQNGDEIGEEPAAEDITFRATLRRGTNTFQLTLNGMPQSDGDQLHQITVEFIDPCGATFVTPEPPPGGESLLLGGDFCESDQSTEVVVSVPDVADGTAVDLLVNGDTKQTEEVADGLVTFEGVTFGVRGSSNDLAVRIAGGDAGGETCDPVAYPAGIDVDCEGPTCDIVAPTPGPSGRLASSDDESPDEPGLQVDVTVTTDGSANGQPVTLVVDGDRDSALMADASLSGDGVEAVFQSVSLANGRQTVQAECTDDEGNVTITDTTWRVDTEGCGISVADIMPAPVDGVITAMSMGGSEDVTFGVEVEGDDCDELRWSVASTDTCDNVGGSDRVMDIMAGDATEFDLPLSLESAGDVNLCAQVRDLAGNDNVVAAPVTFVNGTPELAIQLPAGESGPAAYNALGTEDRIADLDDETDSCEIALVVECEGPDGQSLGGELVSIFAEGEDEALASATCNNGTAVFDAGNPVVVDEDTNLVARAAFDGLMGSSATFAVQADCAVPVLELPTMSEDNSHECGRDFLPDGGTFPDDENEALDGFQRNVTVVNSEELPVEVNVRTVDGTEVSSAGPSTTHDEGTTTFESVDFSNGGDLQLEACATDLAGNRGCTSCGVRVGDYPEIEITAPTAGEVLAAELEGVRYRGDEAPTYEPDPPCDGDGDFNIRVVATVARVPVENGPATVQVADLDPIDVDIEEGTPDDDSDNFISVCIDADELDGTDVTIRVTATNDTGQSTGRVTVGIDSAAPETPGDVVAGVAPACREPATLSWEPLNDLTLAGYEVRCGVDSIATEEEWDAAQVVAGGLGQDPVTESTASLDRLATDATCVVRAYDQAGAYSALPDAGTEVVVELFSQTVVELPDFPDNDLTARYGVFPVGDVDGDGYADFVVAGGGFEPDGFTDPAGRAFLYFGAPSGFEQEPVVFAYDNTIIRNVHPLGNFDSDPDGLDDFQLTTLGEGSFVVFGRPHRFEDGGPMDASTWPALGSETSLLDTDGGCNVDLCIESDEASFGSGGGTAGDFDGDGVPDLGVGGSEGDPVVVLGRPYPRADLFETSTGTCLDVRAVSDGQCEVPDGFRITHPETEPGWSGGAGFVSTGSGDLWFATLGVHDPDVGTTVGAALYGVRSQVYGDDDSGLVLVPSEQVVKVDDLELGSATTDLTVIGDFNGDTPVALPDIVAVGAANRFRVFFGQTDDGSGAYTLRSDRTVGFGHQVGGLPSQLGMRMSYGVLPGGRVVSDIDGDGVGDLMISSGAVSGTNPPEGRAELWWGGVEALGDLESLPTTLFRQDMPALYFGGEEIVDSAQRVLLDEVAEAGVYPYPRLGGFTGDVDNDGRPDFAVVEHPGLHDPPGDTPPPSRLIIMGVCSTAE